jgi:hypothetical protein
MTQTLRRELRLKFEEILNAYPLRYPECNGLAENLADAALEVAGIAKRTDEEKSDYTVQANKKIDAMLDMANFPGAKREARVNSILSYFGETFHVNAETKAWRAFARYVDSEHESKGWDVKQFVSWLYGQKGFDLQFWPPSKMQEFYPAAFVKYEVEPQYKPLPEDKNQYVPNPNRRTS